MFPYRRNDEIGQALSHTEQQYHTKFSKEAEKFIRLAISGIESDPHPLWPLNSKIYQREYLARLGLILAEAAKHAHDPHRVGLFDVLHYTSENLKKLCIIPKRGE